MLGEIRNVSKPMSMVYQTLEGPVTKFSEPADQSHIGVRIYGAARVVLNRDGFSWLSLPFSFMKPCTFQFHEEERAANLGSIYILIINIFNYFYYE